jgi:uncharacterized membrane protein (DUF2068 family)
MVSNKAERLIALFEAVKGLLVLMAGFGLLTLMHHDMQTVAATLISHLHLNPATHYPHVFLELASHIGDTQIWLFALYAFGYAVLRLSEAYGLWHNLQWAQWIAVITGAMYLPVEVGELATKFSWLKLVVFVINVGVVLFMSYKIKSARQA